MPAPVRGQDMRPETDAYDSDETKEKVAQNLAETFGDDSPTPSETEEPEASDDPKPEEQEPEASDDSKPGDTESQDDKKEPEAEAEKDEDAIPDDLFRSARFQEWTPEQIVDLWKTNPEYLKKIHKDTINLSQQFSENGRKQRELGQAPVKAEPAQQQQQLQEDFVDMKKLRDQYEDNPLVDMIGTLNEGLKKAVTERQQVAQQSTQPAGPREEDMLALQAVDSFFSADDMKPFGEFYGTSKAVGGADLSPGSFANRQAVINEAVDILAGAELSRRDMTIVQALEMGHLKVASPHLQTVVRKDILATATKRSKGTTLKPSGTKTSAPTTGKDGKPTEEQLETVTRERINKLFGTS